MKYIVLILWTFSLFLLMFSSFPFGVEGRPSSRAFQQGPGPPTPSPSNCPVLEGLSNPWPDFYQTDITTKSWASPILLEGTARSRSEVRPDGTFGVTFDLHRVVKGDAPLLRRRKQFRLQFLDNPSEQGSSSSSTSSSASSNNNNRNNGLSNVNLNNNRRNNNLNRNRNLGRSVNISSSSSSQLATKSGASNFNSNSNPFTSSLSPPPPPRGLSVPQSSSSSRAHQQFYRQQQLQASLRARGYSNSSRSTSSYNNNYNNAIPIGVSSSSRRRSARSPFGAQTFSSTNNNKCLPPKATVKTGRRYYVFAAKVENHFIAVFSPELANKRNTKGLDSILCSGCGQAPSVVAVRDVHLQVKERLRLRCRLRGGNPLPLLLWSKDGRPVNLTDPRVRLRSKRRQSVLVIRRTKESDLGTYTCEGRNVFGTSRASVKVVLENTNPIITKPVSSFPPNNNNNKNKSPGSSQPVNSSNNNRNNNRPTYNRPSSSKPVGTTPTTLWPLEGRECPFDSYCLNGGTCSYYETIGEYVCQCAEGYKGQRCDTKDITSSDRGGDEAHESARKLLMFWD